MTELLLELTMRALRSFAFAAPCAIFWFAIQKVRNKASAPAHMALTLVCCLYVSGVLAVTGIGRPFSFSPRFSLIPFVDMIKGPVDTTLNVLLFLPLGLFLPLLYTAYDGVGAVARTAFFLSLAIELTQMFGLGITDVNDLMTNTAGACLGYLLYRHFFKNRSKGQSDAKSNACGEFYLMTACLFLSSMALAPAWFR